MNAIIALCHFCELDGPSVLLCTQSYHSTYSPEDLASGRGPQQRPTYFEGRHATRASDTDITSSVRSTQGSLSLPSMGGAHSNARKCEACRTLGGEVGGYSTTDPEGHVSYTTTQYPTHPTLFAVVRKACVRSLSSEVCPGREGPIMFGDPKNGYVLSYTFSLRDCHARGFQRGYSLLCLATDKLYLVNSFAFIVSQFRQVVDYLKMRANHVYEQDVAKSKRRPSTSAFGTMTQDTFRRRRGTQPLRSLRDLTANRKLYAQLHRTFAWVLRSASTRLFERQLEGPPMVSSNISCVLGWGLVRHFTISPTAPALPQNAFAGFFRRLPQRQSLGTFDSTSLSTDTGGMGVEGGGGEDPKDPPPVLSTLPQLVDVLGADVFRVVLYHVLVGNQIIVRGACQRTVLSVLGVLAFLLPRDLVVMVPYSSQYHDRWEGNFLGISESVSVPTHVDPTSYVVLDVMTPAPRVEGPKVIFDEPHGVITPSTPSNTPASPTDAPGTQHIDIPNRPEGLHPNSTSGGLKARSMQSLPGHGPGSFLPPTFDLALLSAPPILPADLTVVLSQNNSERDGGVPLEGEEFNESEHYAFEDFVVVEKGPRWDEGGFKPEMRRASRRASRLGNPVSESSVKDPPESEKHEKNEESGKPEKIVKTAPVPLPTHPSPLGNGTGRFSEREGGLRAPGGGGMGTEAGSMGGSVGGSIKKVIPSANIPYAANQIYLFQEMLRLLVEDSNLSVPVKHQALIALKEEWFSKVKLFFQFTKTNVRATDPSSMARFLSALRLSPPDLPVLRFWVGALTKEDRSKILACQPPNAQTRQANRPLLANPVMSIFR